MNRNSSAWRLFLSLLLLLVGAALPALAQVPSGYARIHYHRTDGKYAGWGLYTWNASTENNSWCTSEVAATGNDGFGVYFDVSIDPTQGTPAGALNFIINNCATGGTKDPGPNQSVQVTQSNQAWVLSGDADVFTTQPLIGDGPVTAGDVRIHYYRPDGNYSGWALYPFNATTLNSSWCQVEVGLTGVDSFGVYFDVPVSATSGSPAGQLGFILNNCPAGGTKDPGVNQYLQVTQNTQGWVISGDATVYTTQPPITAPATTTVRIHYYRPDGNYSGWGLYTWNASTENNSWCTSEVSVSGTDSFGVYFDVTVDPTQGSPVGQLGFIINNCQTGGTKDPGPNQYLQVTQNSAAWVISGNPNVFTSLPTAAQIAGAGLYQHQAFWIDRSTLAIPASRLHGRIDLLARLLPQRWARRLDLRCSHRWHSHPAHLRRGRSQLRGGDPVSATGRLRSLSSAEKCARHNPGAGAHRADRRQRCELRRKPHLHQRHPGCRRPR